RRNPDTLARPWAIPGTPGLEHRIGGLEKQDVTGNVNYEPLNHERMVRLRAAKVEAIVQDVPDAVPAGGASWDLVMRGVGPTARADHGGAEVEARGRTSDWARSSATSKSAAEESGRGAGAV